MAEKPMLTIVSGGPGSHDLLTAGAHKVLETAGRIYTTRRLAEQLLLGHPAVQVLPVAEIGDAVSRQASDAVVLVSGDAGFYSLASDLRRSLEDRYEIQVISGISSLQYLCGKRGIPWQDVRVVSLHGRDRPVLGAVSYHAKCFFLCGGNNGAGAILSQLASCGPEGLTATVGEDLASADERVTTGSPRDLAAMEFSDLSVVLVENPSPADPAARLRDRDFQRGKTPMTKEPVRTLAVSLLDVRPGDVVWDIGAGTGSVSVALAYAARDGVVHAVERSPDAVELLEANRARLGAYNISVARGEAVGAIVHLPPPRRVFIGGSGGTMTAILEALTKLPPPIDVCITAVTLESLTTAFQSLGGMGFGEVEVLCVNAAAAAPLGSYHLMKADNPVHILKGRWDG